MPKGRFYDVVSCYLDHEVYEEGRGEVAGIPGTLCKLANKLTDTQKAELLSYGNVRLFKCSPAYAREIVHNAVFIADRRFPVVPKKLKEEQQ